MKLKVNRLFCGVLFVWALYPSSGLACHPVKDGCLGCTDSELSVCVDEFVIDVCSNGGGSKSCDRERVTDDIERHVLRNTGIHMSRVRAIVRGATRYNHPHSPHY